MSHAGPETTKTTLALGSGLKSEGQDREPAAGPRFLSELRDWLTLAWVLWWSWAYVQNALAQRFPHWLGWTRSFW